MRSFLSQLKRAANRKSINWHREERPLKSVLIHSSVKLEKDKTVATTEFGARLMNSSKQSSIQFVYCDFCEIQNE